MNASLFVYMNKLGIPKVVESHEVAYIDIDPEWKHIGTIDPKAYIQMILDKNPKLVAGMIISGL